MYRLHELGRLVTLLLQLFGGFRSLQEFRQFLGFLGPCRNQVTPLHFSRAPAGNRPDIVTAL